MVLQDRVPVVNTDNRFLSYTNPARARMLLKDGEAEVFSDSPFTIRLKRSPLEGKMAVTNFTKFFEKERDIYIQNKSGRLISLEFTLDSGVVVSHRLAKTPDPCNLTQFVPFSAIKNSIDLRNFANRQPPAIVFMEEEDYLAYFENRAKAHKSSIEEEIARANEKQRAVVNRTESKVVDEHKTLDEKRMELEAKGEPEPEVNPVVQGLCLKVGKDLKPEEIMPAREMLEELESLESNLKPIDYEYVFTHGYHKSIKKWAEKRMSEV